MTTIPHRELRNQSSKILERVKNGGPIDVTNNGVVAAGPDPAGSLTLRASALVRQRAAGFAAILVMVLLADPATVLLVIPRAWSPRSASQALGTGAPAQAAGAADGPSMHWRRRAAGIAHHRLVTRPHRVADHHRLARGSPRRRRPHRPPPRTPAGSVAAPRSRTAVARFADWFFVAPWEVDPAVGVVHTYSHCTSGAGLLVEAGASGLGHSPSPRTPSRASACCRCRRRRRR